MTAEASTQERRASIVSRLVIVAVAVVPMLLSSPGQVSADSRQYLYLDPGGFLARAVSLWDPSVAAGTVPHQHLGFLWPMGPWFWLVDAVGMPTWVGQRLWLAALSALAGLGALRLARALGCGFGAALAVALAYQLTPYQLAFTARFSVLLLPWVALPWLVHLARRAVRERTWDAPLAFGLVAGTAGAVNATSLLLVLVAPAVVVIAAAAERGLGDAVRASVRIGVATALASAWWVAGIIVQGRYGLPVLQFTENVDTVAAASRADDVIRGLGNWIFVSTDGAGTAIEQAAPYQDDSLVRAATVALPAAALAAAVALRLRHRIALLVIMIIGTVVATGHAPLGDPTPYGRLWERFAEGTSAGLALRNTPRIVPVVVLATALLIGLGLAQLRSRIRWAATAAVLGTIAVAIGPVASEGFLADDFDRPEDLPERWTQVAADLDTIALDPTEPGARILEIPGSNFAAYTWGNTVEPVLPGLVRRPTIAREVLPAGGYGTIDLLGALDRRLLNGTFDTRALAPLARLLGVGDIVVRGDLDTARFDLPPVGPLIAMLDTEPPPGFRVTGRYGADADGRPLLLRLSLVDQPTSLVRTDAAPPIVLAGDGDGIVDAAAAGIVDGNRVVLPSVTTDAAGLDDALARGGQLVVTDTNRKAASTFFYTIADDRGATETEDVREPDPTGYDVRLGPYADAPTAAKTVAVQLGGTVRATMAGGPERPEDRAVHAFDGDAATAWRPIGPIGQRITARFDQPVAADDVGLLTTAGAARVTQVRVTTDTGASVDVTLDPAAAESAQTVELGVDAVQEITVEILAVSPDAGDGSRPGLREIRVGGARIDEALRLPTELVDRVGDRAAGRPLHIVLTRSRGDEADPQRPPVERDIDRLVTLPIGADFTLAGAVSGPGDGRCRDDLVRVDGSPVAVAVDADGRLRGCTTVRLDAGEHRVTTAPVGAGPAIDQLVLGAGPPPAPPALLNPRTVSLGERSGRATVEAAGPFWFTLAQSRNDGWSIDVGGGRVVATSMTDGYANGWLIAPDGDAPVTLAFEWKPQRIVWGGFAVTGLLVPLAIVVFGARRRRGREEPAAEWEAAGFRELPASRRAAFATALTVTWAIGWWFVAGLTVAAVVTAALIARLFVVDVRWLLAVGAPAAVVAAEFTDRPSLVFVALGFALAEAVAADRGLDNVSILSRLPG